MELDIFLSKKVDLKQMESTAYFSFCSSVELDNNDDDDDLTIITIN